MTLFINSYGVFMKKYILVLILLLVVISAVGCTESNNKDTIVSSTETSSQGDVSLQQTGQTEYQDKDWASNGEKYTSIISKDLANISVAAKSMDIYSLSTSATFLEAHTKIAIEECDSYIVSPELQPGKEEYRAALVDSNNAATFYTLAVGYLKTGDTTSANQALQTANDKMESAGNHFTNTTTIVNEYNKNHGLTTETSFNNQKNLQQSAQTTTTTKTVYDNSLWINTVATDTSSTGSLITDMNNVEYACSNADTVGMTQIGMYAGDLYESTNEALQHSNSYSVSPELQSTKDEYNQALADINMASRLIIGAVDAYNTRDTDTCISSMKTAKTYIDSGSQHFTTATSLLDAYKKTYGIN